MSENQVSLPQDIYQALLKVAQEKGVTPVEWIASNLPLSLEQKPENLALSERLKDLIGAINSKESPPYSFEKTSFGEGVAAKLAKQGISRQL